MIATAVAKKWDLIRIGEEAQERLVEPLSRIARSDMDQQTRNRLVTALWREYVDMIGALEQMRRSAVESQLIGSS